MKMKKFIALGAVTVMALSSNVIAANGIITVNGNTVAGKVDGNNLPLRSISEALGFDVEWNGETKSIVLSNLPQYVTMTVGVDGYTIARTAPMPLGKAPYIENGITYVPSELFSELLDYKVEKDNGNFHITEKAAPISVSVKEVNNDGILIEDNELGEVMLVLDDDTSITDESGIIADAAEIKTGDSITVLYGDTMTMSLPPINNPKSIVVSAKAVEETTEISTSEETTAEISTEAETSETTTIEETTSETTTLEE